MNDAPASCLRATAAGCASYGRDIQELPRRLPKLAAGRPRARLWPPTGIPVPPGLARTPTANCYG